MGDRNSFDKISKSQDPKECKQLAQNVKPCDEELWKEYICAVTRDVVCVKFEQVKELQDKLVSISK